jgi:DNA-binding NtrC family response regulator
MSKKKILIVDDEPDLRELFADVLNAYDTVQAKDGLEGYTKAKELNPDLILSDIKMPGLSGLEMVARLRKDEIFSAVIFISGFGDTAKQDEAAKLGAFDFLDKPVSSQKLLSTVKNALMLGSKFISSVSSSGDGKSIAQKQTVNFTLENVPVGLLERLQSHCASRGLDAQKTVQKWIAEKLDQS